MIQLPYNFILVMFTEMFPSVLICLKSGKNNGHLTLRRVHRAHSDLDSCDNAEVLVLKQRCNKRSAYTERPTPPLVEGKAPLLKHVHVKERTNILGINLEETEAKNHCIGGAQQQFNRTIDRRADRVLRHWTVTAVVE
jgi:hypothetical protein